MAYGKCKEINRRQSCIQISSFVFVNDGVSELANYEESPNRIILVLGLKINIEILHDC